LPHVIAPSALAPVNGKGATPCAHQTVVLTKQASIERTGPAHSWRAQDEPLVARATALQAAGEAQQAPIRDLSQGLYGTKSATAVRPQGAGAPTPAGLRTRGQPPGSRGHGRRDGATLPVGVAVRELSPAEPYGPGCGAAFRPFPGPAESTLMAVQGQAPGRRIQRQRSHTGGRGPHRPSIVTAPPAPRLMPQRPLGVAVGTAVWRDTDLSGRPPARLGQALQPQGGPRSQGPVTDG
jgi:hypothetical protein